MSPIGLRHAACVDRLTDLFTSSGAKPLVRVQNPVRLDDHSEPLPDLPLLKRRKDYYAGGHPSPADVLLVVEVADTSEAYDRDVKVPLYARRGIPEVWLVRLLADSIRVYRTPENGAYRNVSDFGRGQTLSPSLLAEVALSTDDILG
jgi:Uma2 family endonuclease